MSKQQLVRPAGRYTLSSIKPRISEVTSFLAKFTRSVLTTSQPHSPCHEILARRSHPALTITWRRHLLAVYYLVYSQDSTLLFMTSLSGHSVLTRSTARRILFSLLSIQSALVWRFQLNKRYTQIAKRERALDSKLFFSTFLPIQLEVLKIFIN